MIQEGFRKISECPLNLAVLKRAEIILCEKLSLSIRTSSKLPRFIVKFSKQHQVWAGNFIDLSQLDALLLSVALAFWLLQFRYFLFPDALSTSGQDILNYLATFKTLCTA